MKNPGSAFLLAGMLVAAVLPSVQAQGWAQVTFDNQFGVMADLEYNGRYGCTAIHRLTCTTQVPAGQITLVARSRVDRAVLFQEAGVIQQGSSITWPRWQ